MPSTSFNSTLVGASADVAAQNASEALTKDKAMSFFEDQRRVVKETYGRFQLG